MRPACVQRDGSRSVFYRAQTALLDSLVNSLALTFVLIAITLLSPPGRLPALHGKDCVHGDETPENYALCLSTAESGFVFAATSLYRKAYFVMFLQTFICFRISP